jgi:hypothetical protein
MHILFLKVIHQLQSFECLINNQFQLWPFQRREIQWMLVLHGAMSKVSRREPLACLSNTLRTSIRKW